MSSLRICLYVRSVRSSQLSHTSSKTPRGVNKKTPRTVKKIKHYKKKIFRAKRGKKRPRRKDVAPAMAVGAVVVDEDDSSDSS